MMERPQLGFLGEFTMEDKRQIFISVAANIVSIAVVWAIFVAVKKTRGAVGV